VLKARVVRVARWDVLVGQAARDRLEADTGLLLRAAPYAFDMRHLDRLAIAFAPDSEAVAFAAPSGWTIRLVPHAVTEGLPPWLESLTGRPRSPNQDVASPAFEITDRSDPAPWRAGRPLDCIPERLSLDQGFVERRPELRWMLARIHAGRAEVTAFEVRCHTPPAWIEPIAYASPAGGELHRVLLARNHATTRERVLKTHRDRLICALHALGVSPSEIAQSALVTPSRVSQVAASERVDSLDARSLDQLLYVLSPPPRMDMTPRQVLFIFAKQRVDQLRGAELISLQKDLFKLLRRTSEHLGVWTRRASRIDVAASKAIIEARKRKVSVAEIARELAVTTKTVRLMEQRHGRNQEPPGRKTASAVDAALADQGRLDLVPEERRGAHAGTARRAEKRTKRSRERSLPALLRSNSQDPPR
jgi:hypothetical protein